MKYFDYNILIMGAASLIIAWIDNTSANIFLVDLEY
jgi:hypothetical protein